MRLLQLSDPHLLADPQGRFRGRQPWACFEAALRRGRMLAPAPDLLLISGDLCQDESWAGYARLRDYLAAWPTPVALLPGNHDHPQRLRAALGRQALLAPAALELHGVRLLLLNSHRSGCVEGWLGPRQLAWLAAQLAAPSPLPLLVAVHHPPLAIGDPAFDAIGLRDGPALLKLLAGQPQLRAVLFGHVHQHWQGLLPDRPAPLPPLPLLGCPSTLCGFGPVQPCPLGRPHDPGGRVLAIGADGGLQHTLLRWRCP
jgi:Icc protein